MAQTIVMSTVEMQFRGKAKLDAAGKKVIDEAGKPVIIKERKNFNLQLPFLTKDGLLEILSSANDKAVDALLKAANQVIFQQAKQQVDEDAELADNSKLDLTKLDWNYISTLSTSELNNSASPTKEVLEALAEDYIAIMPALTGSSLEQAKFAAAVFASKIGKSHKHNKNLLLKLQERLGQWLEGTDRAEEFAEAAEWLANRLDSHLKDLESAAEMC